MSTAAPAPAAAASEGRKRTKAPPVPDAPGPLGASPWGVGAGPRTCACGGAVGPDGQCARCRRRSAPLWRRASAAEAPRRTAFGAAGLVEEVLAAPGAPLDSAVRSLLEPRFGHSFAGVRVHDDARAADSARAVGALAYTVGRHVVFAAGQYRPREPEGLRLIAHELTHTLQQGPVPRRAAALSVVDPADAGEAAAERAAGLAVRGERVPSALLGPAGAAIMRQGPVRPRRAPAGALTVRWRGSTRASVFGFLALLTTPDRAAELTNRILSAPTTTYQMGGRSVSRTEFERDHAATFAIGEPLARGIAAALGMTPEELRRRVQGGEAGGAEPDEAAVAAEVTAGRAAAPGERPDPEPSTPTQPDWTALADPALAQRYAEFMEHFGGVPLDRVRPQAQDGLTEDEVAAIVGQDRRLRHLTDLVTQGWREFQQAGGSDLEHYARLEERILEQFVWGNRNAVRNVLKIGRGWPEDGQLGIVDRRGGMLWYDQHADALLTPVGLQYRDDAYIGARQYEHGFNIANVDDPALRMFLNILRQQMGDPTRTVARAAEAYYRNVHLVNERVQARLGGDVRRAFADALPVFVIFLAGHGLSAVLMRSANPPLALTGAALQGLLRAAEYVLEVDFAGTALQRLLVAGEHLARVENDATTGQLTALSRHHLESAAEPIARMVADVALMAATGGFGRLLGVVRGRGGRRVTIECTVCHIVTDAPAARAEGVAGEAGRTGEAGRAGEAGRTGEARGPEAPAEPPRAAETAPPAQPPRAGEAPPAAPETPARTAETPPPEPARTGEAPAQGEGGARPPTVDPADPAAPLGQVLDALRSRPPGEAIPILQRRQAGLLERIAALNERIAGLNRRIATLLEGASQQRGRAREATQADARGRQATRDALVQQRQALEADNARVSRELQNADLRAHPERQGALPCFAAGTPVATPDGPRPIEALRPGDRVLAWDFEAGRGVEHRVTAVHIGRTRHFHRLALGGAEVLATGRHRFWAADRAEWVEARDLAPGAELRTAEGGTLALDAVSLEEVDEAPTYNLSVERAPTYFVGPGVLVHNNGPVNHGLGTFIIYGGTNPAFPGIIYIGQTDQGIRARQGQHRLEAAAALRDPATPAAERPFWEFKLNMTLETRVTGVLPEYASYVEQHNIDYEVQLRGERNVVNRRQEVSPERMRQLADAIRRDPRVIAAGLCPP